jgi:uncharacterized membrane protein
MPALDLRADYAVVVSGEPGETAVLESVRRRGQASGGAVDKSSPTVQPPQPNGLSSVLARNIHTLNERRQKEEAQATVQERIAERITNFTGSMPFVYIHLALFGFWIIANMGVIPGVPIWDPSFVILAMWASVEAIFLSTFVLISQNRMAAAADKRANLDLQISLLAEHEVTKLATLVTAIAERLDVRTNIEGELDEIAKDVAPEAVLDEIEQTESRSG